MANESNSTAETSSPERQPRTKAADPSRFCPTCGSEMKESRCKLTCKTCGFFLSCSDFY
jgi:hypothetical protein